MTVTRTVRCVPVTRENAAGTRQWPVARRRRPSLRFQLAVLGVGLVAIVVASFAADTGGSGRTQSPGLATTLPPTTRLDGFPPAGESSLCRALISTDDAEAIVGRPLRHPVIEPKTGQCAWPAEAGTPLHAELFFEVLPRSERPIEEDLASIFEGLPHRLDAETGLGDAAQFVTRLADAKLDIDEDFVEGLYVYDGEFVVILANGGNDVWIGSDDEVKDRLRTAMTRVLGRLHQLSGAPTEPTTAP